MISHSVIRVYPNGRLHISRVLALSTRGGDISASCLPQNYYNAKYPELEISRVSSWIPTVSSEIKRIQRTNEIDGKRVSRRMENNFFDNSILLKKKSFVTRFRSECILIREMDFELNLKIDFLDWNEIFYSFYNFCWNMIIKYNINIYLVKEILINWYLNLCRFQENVT